MSDAATAAAGVRSRVSGLVRDLDPAGAATAVATCPNWAVHDVVAHLVGVCDDILNGRLDGAATDPWTAAQVDARRDRTIRELVAEWDDTGPSVEALGPAMPPGPASQWVFDLATHEHDVRLALRQPGARDSDAVAIGVRFIVPMMAGVLRDAGLAPLRVVANGWTEVVGEGEPAATLALKEFEALRAFAGRRSEQQLRAYDWDGDSEPYLARFTWGPFRVPEDDVAE